MVDAAVAELDIVRALGFDLPFSPFDRVLRGLQHVDDILVVSPLLCHGCIKRSVELVFPSAFAMEIEEVSPLLRFLQCFLHFSEDSITVSPYHANIQFVLGLTSTPLFCKLVEFVDLRCTPMSTLASFLVSRVHTYNQIFEGDARRALPSCCCLLLEPLLLQWPVRLVVRVLLSLARHRQSSILDMFRTLAHELRTHVGADVVAVLRHAVHANAAARDWSQG